jgi:hypothetical protein
MRRAIKKVALSHKPNALWRAEWSVARVLSGVEWSSLTTRTTTQEGAAQKKSTDPACICKTPEQKADFFFWFLF